MHKIILHHQWHPASCVAVQNQKQQWTRQLQIQSFLVQVSLVGKRFYLFLIFYMFWIFGKILNFTIFNKHTRLYYTVNAFKINITILDCTQDISIIIQAFTISFLHFNVMLSLNVLPVGGTYKMFNVAYLMT